MELVTKMPHCTIYLRPEPQGEGWQVTCAEATVNTETFTNYYAALVEYTITILQEAYQYGGSP